MMNGWQLKTQLFCVQTTAASIVILILAINLIVNHNIVNNLQDQHEVILIQKQLFRHSNISLSVHKSSLEQNLKLMEMGVHSINSLFNFMIYSNINIKSPADICSEQYRDLFCYGLQGINLEDYQQQSEMYKNLTQILNEIKLSLPFKNVYFTSVNQDQYFSIYPESPLFTYQPHSRPWYLNHLESYQYIDFPISDPYLYSSQSSVDVCVTITHNLTYLEELRGVIGLDLSISKLGSIINPLNSSNTSLINENGQLLISPYYDENTSEILYIYNSTLTGISQFNITDWIQNDCNCPYGLKNVTCTYNENGKVRQIIKIERVREFYYIMQIDFNKYQEDILNLYSKQQQYYVTQLIFIFSIIVTYIVLCSFMYIITILCITKPVNRLNLILKKQYNMNAMYLSNLIKFEKNEIDSITILEQTIQNILSQNGVKKQENNFILQQEFIKYPKRRRQFKLKHLETKKLKNSQTLDQDTFLLLFKNKEDQN